MVNNDKRINRFYRSAEWQQARLIKITNAEGRCERCGSVGEEVHHIIYVTSGNVTDVNVTLNQENLVLLCKKCHNEEHDRFKGSKQQFDADGNLVNE